MFVSWQEFIHRPDNVGKPIMEVKRKYLMEQYIHQQNYYSYLNQLNWNAVAKGKSPQTTLAEELVTENEEALMTQGGDFIIV